MSKSIATSKVKVYIRNNWIKIGIASLFLFVLMKKDLSFSVDMNAPSNPPPNEISIPPVKTKEKKKEVLSQRNHSKEETAVTNLSVAPLTSLLGDKEERSDKFWLMDEQGRTEFINRFSHVAENEQMKYGVPASIIIASSLLLSEAGKTEIAQEGNNYFALSCTADWLGEEGSHNGTCYRYYENAWTSFRDNSLYLTTYLFPGKQIPADDHESWAAALEQVKYADEPNLANQLIKIINHYNLYKLDK
jgi:flagellum-specific peptidoglycan hydrolase FlgJ